MERDIDLAKGFPDTNDGPFGVHIRSRHMLYFPSVGQMDASQIEGNSGVSIT